MIYNSLAIIYVKPGYERRHGTDHGAVHRWVTMNVTQRNGD